MSVLGGIVNWWRGLVGGAQRKPVIGYGQAGGATDEHAVIVQFDYGSRDLANLFELEDELIEAVEAAQVGQVDGHEIAMDGSDGTFYIYGPDADRLFEVVRPILASTSKIKQPVARLRYGPAGNPNAAEKIADLGAEPDKGPK